MWAEHAVAGERQDRMMKRLGSRRLRIIERDGGERERERGGEGRERKREKEKERTNLVGEQDG